MCGNQKFFICEHCKNLVGMIENKGVPLMCCGENMKELVPNTVDASMEKHVPVITKTNIGINVSIGSEEHPMTSEHNISFVYVETKLGGQRKCFPLGSKAVAEFAFIDDEAVAVYAYCNLHGLWKKEV